MKSKAKKRAVSSNQEYVFYIYNIRQSFINQKPVMADELLLPSNFIIHRQYNFWSSVAISK